MRQAGLEHSLQYATVWMNHAGNKRLQKDLQASLDMFLSAKKMMEECGAQETYYYISLLNNIALTYMELGRLAQAEAYAMYALNTLDDGTDYDHEKASTYNNLANIHMAMCDYESAQSDIASALQLYEKMPNNIHYAAALQTKAELEVRNGNHGLARVCLEHACTLTEHFFGRGDAYATLQKQLRDLPSGSDITRMGQ